ncbi:uncharacterized protein FA14DRAFT_95109 [Meira miltonrushii]|uniref:Glycosyltransferase family 25 protein n=1 Tax=Meira miltonrushii TaxID=1280837 RepID=A0A316V288_9BASI|nr:uncharacterized protein FA14DRAFT_95109 [Meira miltonrushii]PWN31384.1 hypothetical protein FA14DRAFT_95109 [Meira miltonrushii]
MSASNIEKDISSTEWRYPYSSAPHSPQVPSESINMGSILPYDNRTLPASMRSSQNSIFRRYRLLFAFLIIVSGFTFLGIVHKTLDAGGVSTDVVLQNKMSDWIETQPEMATLPHIFSGNYSTNPVNSTLGFQKILVIHLPYRMDKKDQLLIMSRTQGIDLTFSDGRTPESVKDSGLPWQNEEMTKDRGVVALFRGHMDAIQHILDENLSSALILEDDSDWDVDVKYAIQRLQQPLATLIKSFDRKNDSNIVSTKNDPWLTSEWDVLNIGACIELPFKEGDRKGEVDLDHPPYVAYKDGTLDYSEHTHEHLTQFLGGYNLSLPKKADQETFSQIEAGNYHRIVTLSNKPICTNAYAVSKKGAIKLLYHFSKAFDMPIDVKLMLMSVNSEIRSYTVSPPIMDQWKAIDAEFRSSDKFHPASVKFVQEDEKLNHNPWLGYSRSIKNSIRADIYQKMEANKF